MISILERIDNITKIGQERLKTVIPPPKSVKIELTGICNYKCSFCSINERTEKASSMDIDFFKKITTDMKAIGVEEIGVFYIGESTLKPKLLLDCVKFLKQEIQMPYVFLTTNGSQATPELVNDLMAAGLDSLKWSVNAYSKEQFEQLMKVSKTFFDKAINNLKAAWQIKKEKKYKTLLSASSIAYDSEHCKQMDAFLNEHIKPYVDTHYWLPLYNSSEFAAKRQKELGYNPTVGNQGRLSALRDPLPCWAVFTEGHVRADGTLTACCFDSTGDFVMGDLHTQTFSEAWNNEKFQKLRQAHLNKNVKGTVCENCLIYK